MNTKIYLERPATANKEMGVFGEKRERGGEKSCGTMFKGQNGKSLDAAFHLQPSHNKQNTSKPHLRFHVPSTQQQEHLLMTQREYVSLHRIPMTMNSLH